MNYLRRKRQLAKLRKALIKNGGKFIVKKRPSKPTRTEPSDQSDPTLDMTLADDKQADHESASYAWLLDELGKRWRSKVSFLSTERFTFQDPDGVYVLASTYYTLHRQTYYGELRAAIYNKLTFNLPEEMQFDLLTTVQPYSATFPIWKPSDAIARLVVVESTIMNLDPSLETLNSWMDALMKDGDTDFRHHREWLAGDHDVSQAERSRLHLLLKKLTQLEAKTVAITTCYNNLDQTKDVYGVDATLVTPSAISRDVLDTILIRHPVLSQALQGIAKIYMRGRLAVVRPPKEAYHLLSL